MTASVASPAGGFGPDESVGFELLDEVRLFFEAQRLDVEVMRGYGAQSSVVQADDDFSLVNTHLVWHADQLDNRPLWEMRDWIERRRFDSLRTDLVIPDSHAGQTGHIHSGLSGLVRRVVCRSDLLDGFLRPRSICQDLVDGGDAKRGLLNEADFVDQWADVDDVGRVSAQKRLFQGWAQGAAPRIAIVIGPAGHGKSKVTHILAKRLARHYLDSSPGARPPVPILLAVGDHRGFSSFSGLILSALQQFGNPRLTIEAFQYLVSLERVLFIIDGYDEMIEANKTAARENIYEFFRSAGPASRILLTARSSFYRTASDLVGQVGDPLLTEGEIEILDMQPFDLVQARNYLAQRLSGIQDRSRALERAQGILESEGALEVLGSPIFLAEFAEAVTTQSWSLADVRRVGSMEFLIERAFRRERERQGHEFSDEQQRIFLEDIAFDMLSEETAGYQRADLEIFAPEAADIEQDSYAGLTLHWEKLASHHFLAATGKLAGSLVAISHQVWRDYFQGCALASRLNQGNAKALSTLAGGDLPEGVLRAAAQHLDERVKTGLVANLRSHNDHTVRNMIQIELFGRDPDPAAVYRLPETFAASLVRRDLSNLSFSRIDFGATSLAGADLTGAHFQSCDLSRVSLENAQVVRTNFRGCELPNFANAEVASLWIDGEVRFRAPTGGASDESAEVADDGATEAFADWAAEMLRIRLGKFVKRQVGEHNVVLDNSISWTAFMGGTDPRDREFVTRRVYRALHAERVVSEGKINHNGRPAVHLTADPAVRAEIVAFVDKKPHGGHIEAVLERLAR